MSKEINTYFENQTKSSIEQLKKLKIIDHVISKGQNIRSEIVSCRVEARIYISVINGFLHVSGDYGDMVLSGGRSLREYADMDFHYFMEKCKNRDFYKRYEEDLFFTEIRDAYNYSIEDLEEDEIRNNIDDVDGLYLNSKKELCKSSTFPEDQYRAYNLIYENMNNIFGEWTEFNSIGLFYNYRSNIIWQLIRKVDQVLYPEDYEEIEGVLTKKKTPRN